ncbi:MAG TPA: tRNA (adenosine(37)-N6)-threonylcarbamoyltransferase complex ATPase subunit type 1 TsaE [Bacteroidota bacterium]|nr:tRNA (adenosine(37)-N6)-threonylcarbamoyltransferase complex ATPase subunit type 1 TsaE [Bacteroidota bacterium]
MQSFATHTEQETTALGVKFAHGLRGGDVVALFGDLGSGKTRFIQGACKGLGVVEHVTSPTFTIVNEYNAAELRVFHFDFYRIESLNEIRDIGFQEYLDGGGICLIEWAEKAMEFHPPERYDVHLSYGESENMREVTITRVAEVSA